MHDDKRNFLRTILGFGAGAAAAAGIGSARAQTGAAWQPTMEPQDAWLDQIGGRHRQVFDTISPEGVARALTFTYTFYAANKDGYGIAAKDLGVVMILRSGSTPYGFNDAFWAKYSAPLAERTKLMDPATKSAAMVNLYNAADKAALMPTNGLTLDTLTGWGGHIAVCSVAARRLGASLAQATNGNADAVFAEMGASLVGGARFVPAGVVAVNRTQERHFAICYTA